MQHDYRSTLVEQMRKYTPALPPGKTDSLRTTVIVGELSLASVDLVSALVDHAVPVAPQDMPTLRWLLESVPLPPDTRPTSPTGWWSSDGRRLDSSAPTHLLGHAPRCHPPSPGHLKAADNSRAGLLHG